MAYDLRPIVFAAIRNHGNRYDGSFGWIDFSLAVVRTFDLRDGKDQGWCEGLLATLPYVARSSNGRDWRLVVEPPRERTSRPAGSWKVWGPGPSPSPAKRDGRIL